MKTKIVSVLMLVLSFLSYAQNTELKNDVQRYSENVEEIVRTEKGKMNKEIDALESRFNNGDLSEAEFNAEKQKIAERYEQIINQKIEEQRADLDSITNKTVSVAIFSRENSSIVSVEHKKQSNPADLLKDNDVRVAYSFMNLAKDEGSLNPFENDSQMRIGNSHSVQVFFRQKRQLGSFESLFFISYGVEYRADTYMPKKPQVFAETTNELYLENFQAGDLKRSKLRNVYFTLPVEFSWVLNPKYTSFNDTKYLDATKSQFKIGAGVYAGVRTRSIIKVKYHDNNDKFDKYKNVVDSGINSFVFGGRLMVSYAGISLFLQKDFTPTFDNKAYLPNKNNVQLGIIFGSLGF